MSAASGLPPHDAAFATLDDAPDRCLWTLRTDAEIQFRQWGDDVVVFVGERASTHLLGAAAGGALISLVEARRALTVDALFASAFGETAAPSGVGLSGEPVVGPERVPIGASMTRTERDALLAVLVEFEQLGIVGRVPRAGSPDATVAAASLAAAGQSVDPNLGEPKTP